MAQFQKFDVTYDVWKQVYQNHSSSWSAYQKIGPGRLREAWTGNTEYIFATTVQGHLYSDYSSSIESSTTDVSSSEDAIALIVAGVSNIPEQPRNSDGSLVFNLAKTQNDNAPLIAIQGRVGSEVIYATHNFCDETTWYSNSERIVSASFVQSGSVWATTASNGCWIDMTHGQLFDEEGLIEDQQIFAAATGGEAHGYSVSVFVDGVEKTQRTAFADSGGDFTINYTSGTITPVSGQDWSGSAVTASFSQRATTPGASEWVLEPLPDKVLVMEKAEIQFAEDIEFSTSLVMDVYGYAAYFAPQLIQANGGPYPNDTRVPIDTMIYKTMDQLVDEAVQAFPQIPPMGGSVRGFQKTKNIFQFHYGSVRKLFSSLGLQVRIRTEDDSVFPGERATATFYCTSQDDPGYLQALTEMGLI